LDRKGKEMHLIYGNLKKAICLLAIALFLSVIADNCIADSASVTLICAEGGTVGLALKNIDDNQPAEGGLITWSDVTAGETAWKIADQYIEISHNNLPQSWGIQLYTDNKNESADPKYTGTANPVGLVNIDNTIMAIPMAWRITDSVISNPIDNPEQRPDGTGFNDYMWHFLKDKKGQVFKQDTIRKIKFEADYILSCQYYNEGNLAHGAINNVYGDPTWVVPRENAMAILALIIASDVLGDVKYKQKADLAADYLINVQESDGAWCNQYNYTSIHDPAKSPTQTAEVMMALGQLGYKENRYNAMKEGAEFLISCQDVSNIGGINHGLLGGGKDASGIYSSWRWTSDNSYAYQALKTAKLWAEMNGDSGFAANCAIKSGAIIEGIDNYLYNPDTGVWHVAIDADGVPLDNPDLPADYNHNPNWISYSPQMLNLPVYGVNLPGVGEWIKNAFQQDDGSCIAYSWEDGDNQSFKTRKYPGYSFQSALCWLKLGQNSYADSAISWAENSGLWQKAQDENNIVGGWVDWTEISPVSGNKAHEWERFIDTSFYAIACWVGGYDFNIYANNSVDYGSDPFVNGEDYVTLWNQAGIAWNEGGRSGNPKKAYIYLAAKFTMAAVGAEYNTSTLTIEVYDGISPFPIYLYKDAPKTEYPDESGATLENHFSPSGWDNYAGQFSVNPKCKDVPPYSGEHFFKITWNGNAGSDGWKWGSIMWLEPEDIWGLGGNSPTHNGYDLRGADYLSFWARTDSTNAGLQIETYFGNTWDSCGQTPPMPRTPLLNTTWQQYLIPVLTRDMSDVTGGVAIVFKGNLDPDPDGCVIYLDDIKFDKY
jgi:hypothetical protein